MSSIPDLPAEPGDHDCPICYEPNVLRDRAPICPNGHTFCADCQPRIQSVFTGWGLGGERGACCPLCRGPIPYVPLVVPVVPLVVPVAAGGGGGGGGVGGGGGGGGGADARAIAADERQARHLRAVEGFQNLPARRQAQALFRLARDEGRIPANAAFGGIHKRNCPCGRHSGAHGVRFLKMPDNKRLYRCEVCYINAYAAVGRNGTLPPPPPEWSMNGVAAAAHADYDV